MTSADARPDSQHIPSSVHIRNNYDPQLSKFGWIRVSVVPLTIDELYKDK